MEYVIIFIQSMAPFFSAYLFCQLFLEQKPKWKPPYIVSLLLALVSVFMLTGHGINLLSTDYFVETILRFARTIILLGMAMLPLLGRKGKKAPLLVVFTAIYLVSEVLAVAVYSLITGQPFNMNVQDPLDTNLVITLASAMIFSIVAILQYVLLRTRYDRIETGGFKHVLLLELAIPLVSVLITCLLVSLQNAVALYASALVLLLSLLAYLVYSIYQKQALVQNEREHQQKLKETHYKELERHQAEIRTIKHDMKNQLIAMNAYVQTGSAERAGEEIRALIAQLEDSTKYAFTENAALNGLLAQKYKRAKEEKILCDFHISLPVKTGFADADMVAFLGNVLDNAIEACLRCDSDRYIRLEINCLDCVFLLRCTNSTDGQANSLKTRKRDTGRHGFGMKSIKQVVEKYNGDMKYSFGPDCFEIELSMFCPDSL